MLSPKSFILVLASLACLVSSRETKKPSVATTRQVTHGSVVTEAAPLSDLGKLAELVEGLLSGLASLSRAIDLNPNLADDTQRVLADVIRLLQDVIATLDVLLNSFGLGGSVPPVTVSIPPSGSVTTM